MWGGVGLAWGGMLAFGWIWFQCWCCGDDGTDDTIWWWCSVAKCDFGRWCTVSRHHGCHLSVRSWPQRWQGLDRYVHAERMRVSKCEAVTNKSVEKRRRFFYVCRYHVRTLRQICLSKLPNWLNWLKIIYAEQKNMRCSVGATLLVPLIWTLKAKLRENYCKTPRLNTSSWPSFRSVNCYNFP